MTGYDPEREATLLQNYTDLKEIVDIGLDQAAKAPDHRSAKNVLIGIQEHFRGLQLRREDREELYGRLQEAFTRVNTAIDAERAEFENAALEAYRSLKPAIEEAAEAALEATDTRTAWERLLALQDQLRNARMMRDHRDELFTLLRVGFDTIKQRRDEEHRTFELESSANYARLKALVADGLRQAEETHEYKETREYLKKIQSEFRGIRLAHEQREELYSRLQTAFDILGKRLDDYFRNKKKNWAVRMEYNIQRISADIHKLDAEAARERETLEELTDQLEIALSSGRDAEVIAGIRARIEATKRSIEQRRRQAGDLIVEKAELQSRLEEPADDDEN